MCVCSGFTWERVDGFCHSFFICSVGTNEYDMDIIYSNLFRKMELEVYWNASPISRSSRTTLIFTVVGLSSWVHGGWEAQFTMHLGERALSRSLYIWSILISKRLDYVVCMFRTISRTVCSPKQNVLNSDLRKSQNRPIWANLAYFCPKSGHQASMMRGKSPPYEHNIILEKVIRSS